MFEIEFMEWLIAALWIFYIIFLLIPLIVLDFYTDYTIKKLQKERRTYNLKSEYLEIELSPEDTKRLYRVMMSKGYTNKDKYINDKLKALEKERSEFKWIP
ncbi:MAG: hypothetical protein SPD90_04320 [Intestinibacter sp.]|uniref:DUF2852 domain-containing protein n=1 Tax=Intestinibacter sp. TaxID=1965304 RepID=UPI002A80B517|nr:DUF2852 domain-containing protein [Intestinibacter sp.]MDY4574263.1 hypothetical protein [Intestinibacter sp.]